MGAPVTGRVTSLAEADRHIRNHHERLVELERLARAAGRRWRRWPGAALQPVTETQDISRSSSLFIFNTAGTALLCPDTDPAERIVSVHALVDAAAVASIAMRLYKVTVTGGFEDISPTATSVGTAIELLSLFDLAPSQDANDAQEPRGVVFVAGTAADRVNAVFLESEPYAAR